MKIALITLILILSCAPSFAQTVVSPCTQVPGSNGMPASCVPVGTSSPLPVRSN